MAKQKLILPPLTKVDLTDFNASYHRELSGDKKLDEKTATKKALKYTEKISKLQAKLYAQGQHENAQEKDKQSLLIILQGMDASGKDGTVKHVFTGINPQGVYVHSFKKPTKEELSHDFLWRIENNMPKSGMIGIFNRSQYEDVLVVRVNNLVPQIIWQRRYDTINDFEKKHTDNGTKILKFFLNISKDEQKKRLEARLENPDDNWKFSMGDLPVRKQWEEYMQAYEDVLTKCNTAHAPWIIVPSDNKWYRNYVVSHTILNALKELNPQYPQMDLAGIKIE